MGVRRWDPPKLTCLGHRIGQEKKATFWELFFDLVLVAAVSQLSHMLAHAFEVQAHQSDLHESTHIAFLDHFQSTFFLFVVYCHCFWITWITEMTYNTRFDGGDDFLGRFLNFILMFGVGAMAFAIKAGLTRKGVAEFALAFFVSRIASGLKSSRAAFHVDPQLSRLFFPNIWIDIINMVFAVPAMIPDATLTVQVICLCAPFVTVTFTLIHASERSQKAPLNPHHFPERFGIFTILLLGELVLAIVNNGEFGLYGNWRRQMGACLCFMVAFALWWTYFDNIEGKLVNHRISALVWVSCHFFLMAGLVGLGASMDYILEEIKEHPRKYVVTGASIVTITSFTIATLSIGTISLLTLRRKERDLNMYNSWKHFTRFGIVMLFAMILQLLQLIKWSPIGLIAMMCSFSIIRVLLDVGFLIERLIRKRRKKRRERKQENDLGVELNDEDGADAPNEGNVQGGEDENEDLGRKRSKSGKGSVSFSNPVASDTAGPIRRGTALSRGSVGSYADVVTLNLADLEVAVAENGATSADQIIDVVKRLGASSLPTQSNLTGDMGATAASFSHSRFLDENGEKMPSINLW